MRPIRNCQWYENGEPCINMVEGTTDFCASHGHQIRREAKRAAALADDEMVKQPGAAEKYRFIARHILELFTRKPLA